MVRLVSDCEYTTALPSLCSLEAQGEGLLGEELVHASKREKIGKAGV